MSYAISHWPDTDALLAKATTTGERAAAADSPRQDAGVPRLLRHQVRRLEGLDRRGGEADSGRRAAQPGVQLPVPARHRARRRGVPVGRRRQPLHRLPAGRRTDGAGQQLRAGARPGHRGAAHMRPGHRPVPRVRVQARRADQPAHAERRDVPHARQRHRGVHGGDPRGAQLHRPRQDHQGGRRLPRLERPAGLRHAHSRQRTVRGRRHSREHPAAHAGDLSERHRRRERPARAARTQPGGRRHRGGDRRAARPGERLASGAARLQRPGARAVRRVRRAAHLRRSGHRLPHRARRRAGVLSTSSRTSPCSANASPAVSRRRAASAAAPTSCRRLPPASAAASRRRSSAARSPRIR